MADFGYTRDERYGPSQAEVIDRHQPAPSAPSTGSVTDARSTEPSPPRGKPHLAVQPTALNFQDLGPSDTRRVALRVRNTGDAPLQARVVSRIVGVSAPNRAFELPPGKQARVLLTIVARDLPSEDIAIPRAVEVESNAGTTSIALRAQIRTAPLLHVVTPELDFGQQTATDRSQQILVLENRGRRALTGRVVANALWLVPQREAFQCMGGQQVRLPVSLRSEALTRGLTAQDDALLVDSDGGQARIAAQVFLAKPQLQLGVDALTFGEVHPDDTLTAVLMLHNTGDAELRGSARSHAPCLQVDPNRFICPAGETVQLSLVLSTANMAPGPLNLERALQIRTNGGDAVLPLRAEIRAPRLVLIDEIVDLGEVRPHERAQGDVRLRNDGNALLVARADVLVPWLSFADGSRTTHISIEPGATTVALSLVADLEALQAEGEIRTDAAVRLVSEMRLIELPARLRVLKPALAVEPEALDFRYIERSDTETLSLQISNTGTGQLGWSAAVDAEWVEVTPTSGVIAPGDTETLTLTAYGLALGSEEQTAEATLAITSDAGRIKIPLRVGIAAPLLATDTTQLCLGPSINRQPTQGTIRIFNHGLGTLKGVIASDRTWLVTERSAFDCPTGRSLAVGLHTDMGEFPEDATEDEATLAITSNGGEVTVRVKLAVSFAPDLVSATETIVLHPGEDAYQGRLVLRNRGLAPARSELFGSVPQLILSRHLCDVKPGKGVRIVVEYKGVEPRSGEPLYVEVQSAQQSLRIPVELAD
ncbi:MAG: BACON domain-containing protein [Anaerolineae bacterium]|nr:BACON domain-containing protein [Anaerolineae bacterium]